MPTSSANSGENRRTRVIAELRAAILSGELGPATRLRTQALAVRFGASRSPVREALLALEREGLVETIPNRGAVVRSFDPPDLIDLYRLRCVLEPYAAARAAVNVDGPTLARIERVCDASESQAAGPEPQIETLIELNEEFHGLVLDAASSPRLAESMKGTAELPRQFRAVFWSSTQQRDRSLGHHREVLRAMRRGNGALASTAMHVHVAQALEFLENWVSSHPGAIDASADPGRSAVD
jgi:DNA-binding GntR family transcriptional regulator